MKKTQRKGHGRHRGRFPRVAGSVAASASGEDPSLGAEELRAVGEAIAREFPLAVEQTGVVLMDVDPFHVHVYWSLLPDTYETACAGFGERSGGARLVLRFREIPDGDGAPFGLPVALDVFDQQVPGPRGQAEVDVWGPGRVYEAELGLTAEDGGWLSLARSNRVRLPPVGPEDLLDMADTPAWPANPAPVQEPRPAGVSEFSADPSLARLPAGELEPEFPNVAPTHRATAPEGDEVRHLELRIPASADGAIDGRFSAQGDGEIDGRFSTQGDRAIPNRVSAPGGDEVSETVLSLSSATLAGAGSDLELHAELHIHGRARPGSDLRLFGRRVPLGPDGTFAIRRSLPADLLLSPLLMSRLGEPEEGGRGH